MVVAVVASSWIPCVNAMVAAAVIGALQAGMESGWNLESMAVGAVVGAISAYGAGTVNIACKAGAAALEAGYESGWNIEEMGEAALVGGTVAVINANYGKANGWGALARDSTTGALKSCQENGWNTESVLTGIASGVGNNLGNQAVKGLNTAEGIDLDIDDGVGRVVYTAVSSASSKALIASVKGEDIIKAATQGLVEGATAAALKEVAEELYERLPEDEAYLALTKIIEDTANAAAEAVAAVVSGTAQPENFLDTLRANFKQELMNTVDETLKAKAAQYEKDHPPEPTAFASGDVNAFILDMTQQEFIDYARETFGDDIDAEAAAALYNDIKSGKLKAPEVKVTDDGLDGNYAGYNRDSDTILISADMVDAAQTSPMEAWKVRIAIAEETGHFLDDQLRNEYSNIGSLPGHADAAGDEGARFV